MEQGVASSDYSAVMAKSRQRQDLRQIGFNSMPLLCVRVFLRPGSSYPPPTTGRRKNRRNGLSDRLTLSRTPSILKHSRIRRIPRLTGLELFSGFDRFWRPTPSLVMQPIKNLPR
jgi:hypothetical protein